MNLPATARHRLATLCQRFLGHTQDIVTIADDYPDGITGLLEDRAAAAALFAAAYADEPTASEVREHRPPVRRLSRSAHRDPLQAVSTRVDPGNPHGSAPARCRH